MTAGNRQPFDWKTFIRGVAVIAIPIALQSLLTTTGSMIDTVMIASLGEKTVAAVGLCAQFSSLMFASYFGFVAGGMLFISQYWGAKDEAGIDRSYGLMLLCLMTVGILFGVLAVFFPEQVMALYTDKTAIQEIGVKYLRIAGLSYPLVTLTMSASSLLRCTERVRIPLAASIVSVLTNIFLNWVLIFGRFGLPAMGVQGAAVATVSASFVNAALVYIVSAIRKYPYLFHFRAHFRWKREHAALFLRKCAPILANEILIGVSGMIINIVLGHQSEPAIAAVAVFRTIEGLFIGFFSGFSSAASILVGKAVGAGEHEEAWERAKRIVYLTGGAMLVLSLILQCVKLPILRAMGLSGESLEIGSKLLLIFGGVAVIRLMNWVQNDTYRSAGDSVTGTVMEIVFMYVLVLPILLLNYNVFHTPLLLLFALIYIDEPIRFILMQIHMYSGRWIRPVTPEGQAALPEFRARHNIRMRREH